MSPTSASVLPALCTWSTAVWSTRRKARVCSGARLEPRGMTSTLSSRKRSSSSRSRAVSAPAARRIFSPETSLATANSRCSRVRWACRRDTASRAAAFRTRSTVRLNIGLLDGGSQRVSLVPRQLVNGAHLGLRDLVQIRPADPATLQVHLHHDPERVRRRLLEDRLQHVDHELHRRVVVVVEDDVEEPGLCGLD